MLDKTLVFLKLLRDFEKVERILFRRDGDRAENDVEHSYQVAMMSWFLSEQFKLPLSQEKLLKYGLVHDLVEVYAGDTPVFLKNHIGTNTHFTKKEREARALIHLKKEFSHFDDFIETIESYESKKDDESVFIYELDKILPPLNAYLDNGHGWNKFNITLEEISTEKRNKVKNSKELIQLLEEMLGRFENEKDRLFTSK